MALPWYELPACLGLCGQYLLWVCVWLVCGGVVSSWVVWLLGCGLVGGLLCWLLVVPRVLSAASHVSCVVAGR